MCSIEQLAARTICAGFDGLAATVDLQRLIHRGVSSIILFTRNYESPQQLSDLCREIKSFAADHRPIMICIDQEGGRVQRLREPFTIIPSMREIGKSDEPALARRVGHVLATELRPVNIDMNLAPVLDVDSNPANPVIGERSFGSDPNLVASMGCALIEEMQHHGVAACGKHFPGHGDTSIDSHFHLPHIAHDLDRLNQIELPPFAAAINAGVAAIMAAHIIMEKIDPEHPASMSSAVIDGLLRTRMGFDRVVISDDLEMKAIVDHFGVITAVTQGLRAGVNLFSICHTAELQHRAIDELVKLAQKDPSVRAHLEQSNRRLNVLFDRFVKPAQPWNESAAALIGCPDHRHAIGPKSLAPH